MSLFSVLTRAGSPAETVEEDKMKQSWLAIGLVTLLAVSPSAYSTSGNTDRARAIEAGAVALSSDEIAELLVGHTLTARTGQKTFLFYYGSHNDLAGKLIDGSWSDSGYYGINDENEVCLSISKDRGRLRCISLLRFNGVIRKYNAAGKMTFEIVKVEAGNRL